MDMKKIKKISWAISGLVLFVFDELLRQINVKSNHLVSGAGSQTHILWKMSLLP